MTDRLLVLLTCLAFLATLSATSAAWAQVPEISAKTQAAGTSLTDEQRREIDTFVTFYAEKLAADVADAAADATWQRAIIAARDAVVRTYSQGAGSAFRMYFAESIAKDFVPAVLGASRPQALVNAAIAVSKIDHPSVAPGLERMVAHANPAVRYCGMAGYVTIRDELLREEKSRTALLEMLAARAEAETSAPVLVLGVGAADLTGSQVGEAILRPIRPAALEIIVTVLKSAQTLQLVRDNDTAAFRALAGAATAAGSMGESYKNDDRVKPVLDALAAVLVNAGEAYWDFSGIDGDKPSRLEPAQAWRQLMGDCERAMRRLTGKTANAVSEAIRTRVRIPDARAVKLAVNEWVGSEGMDGVLTPLGVATPKPLEATPKRP